MEARAAGAEVVGLEAVARMEAPLLRDARPGHGPAEDSHVGFLRADVERVRDRVKVLREADLSKRFRERVGRVRDDPEAEARPAERLERVDRLRIGPPRDPAVELGMDLVEHRVVRLQAEVLDDPRIHLPEELVLPARGERADQRDDRLRRPEEANDPLAVHEMASSREDAVEDLRCGRLRIEERPAHVEEDVAHVLERLVAARRTRLQSHRGPSSNTVRKALRRPYSAACHPRRGSRWPTTRRARTSPEPTATEPRSRRASSWARSSTRTWGRR